MYSPLDIKNKNFKAGAIGFNKKEVKIFLEEIAEQVTELLRENKSLTEKIENYEKEKDQLNKQNEKINEILLTAQDVVKNIKHNAMKESKIIIEEAKLESETIKNKTINEKDKIEEKIENLKQVKLKLKQEIKSLIDSINILITDE